MIQNTKNPKVKRTFRTNTRKIRKRTDTIEPAVLYDRHFNPLQDLFSSNNILRNIVNGDIPCVLQPVELLLSFLRLRLA